MALRRVLPSRQPGAAAPETKGAPTPAPSVEVSKKTEVSSSTAAPAAAIVPVETKSVETKVAAAESQIAAAAASAFSTLPGSSSAASSPAAVSVQPIASSRVVEGPSVEVAQPEAAPVRILEDSFTTSVAPVMPSVPMAAPVPMVIEDAPSVADFQPSSPPAEAVPSTSKNEAPAETSVPSQAASEEIEPQKKPETSASKPAESTHPVVAQAEEVVSAVSAASPEPKTEQQQAVNKPQQESRPGGATRPSQNQQNQQNQHNQRAVQQNNNHSPKGPRPSDNPLKRRVERGGNREDASQRNNLPSNRPENRQEKQVQASNTAVAIQQPIQTAPQEAKPASAEQNQRVRVKRQRDFAAATVAAPAEEKARPSAGTNALAEHVPVNTRPLDKVDEELIASGIIAGPAADTLTSSVPVSLAVAEEQPYFYTEEPQSEAAPSVPPLQPASTPAPMQEVAPQPQAAAPQPSPTPTLPEPSLPAPSIPDFAQPAPLPAPSFTPTEIPSTSTASVTLPSAASAPLPAVTSDLPWTTSNSGWEVDLPTSLPETPETSNTLSPPADFFKPQPSTPAVPAWAHGTTSGHTPPPELPGARGLTGPSTGRSGAPVWGMGLAGVAVAVIAFFIWHNGGQQNQLQEKVASWTGSLGNHDGNTEAVKPESTFSMADMHRVSSTLLPPPTVPGAQPAPLNLAENPTGLPPVGSVSSSAQIDFADVPPDQANQPIVADGSEKMPEDVSLFAKFQQAVAEARANKRTGGDAVSGTAVAAVEKNEGPLTPEKLKEELSAYRRSLMEGTPPTAAKTPAMEKDPAAYMDGKNTASADGKGPNGELLPPPDLYTNNPKNLPIVGEPVANAPARIRTLADFEAEPFEPEKPKVRIPRTLKPKMAATDFPSLQVLSYVPGRGIIAYAGGREGVLLLGETFNGWELTSVTTEVAEFRAGQKRHYISANE